MEKKEIIESLQSIKENFTLSAEQHEAIKNACSILENATKREQWVTALKELGPLAAEIVLKIIFHEHR